MVLYWHRFDMIGLRVEGAWFSCLHVSQGLSQGQGKVRAWSGRLAESGWGLGGQRGGCAAGAAVPMACVGTAAVLARIWGVPMSTGRARTRGDPLKLPATAGRCSMHSRGWSARVLTPHRAVPGSYLQA